MLGSENGNALTVLVTARITKCVLGVCASELWGEGEQDESGGPGRQ